MRALRCQAPGRDDVISRKLDLDGDGKRVVEVSVERGPAIKGDVDVSLWFVTCLCGQRRVRAYAGEYVERADAGDSEMLDDVALDGICDACFKGVGR